MNCPAPNCDGSTQSNTHTHAYTRKHTPVYTHTHTHRHTHTLTPTHTPTLTPTHTYVGVATEILYLAVMVCEINIEARAQHIFRLSINSMKFTSELKYSSAYFCPFRIPFNFSTSH